MSYERDASFFFGGKGGGGGTKKKKKEKKGPMGPINFPDFQFPT